jgi:threonine dehydratase
VGGGGLIAGIALAMKTMQPGLRVIGVEPKRCASYSAALEAGLPVPVAVMPTLADGLAVPQVGAHAFAVARHWVDEIVTVDEAAVALAVLRLLEGEKMVVEGGGAAGLAAMLPGGPLDRLDLKVRAICVPSACHRSALGVPSECL